MSRLRNIGRVDEEKNHTHAWFVRFQRCNESIHKTFSDGVYGGKRRALKAAIEFREAQLLQYSLFDHEMWVRSRLRKNNHSGIVGVGRYERPDNPETGHRSAFWLASWVDENGTSRKRKFAVSVYSERQAKRLAVAERQRQLDRVCGIKTFRS